MRKMGVLHVGGGPAAAHIIFACCLIALCVVVVRGSVVNDTVHSVRLRHDPSHSKHQQQQQNQEGEDRVSSSLSNYSSSSSPAGPYFLAPPSNHFTVRAGQTAVLTCIVKHLGNRQVSWIRGRDLHVLSSGQVTFSSDSRVSVSYVPHSWLLTIKYTQPRDAGSYLCQVNTQPPIATWYNLTVIEVRANILGKETLYVQSGSTVTLECVIRQELVIPGLVLWYQDDRLVERDSGRVKVDTRVDNVTTSTLTVTAAALKDSGNYSCWPSAGRPDSVLVHVIQGDPPAAMQHGNSAAGVSALLLVPTTLTSLMFLQT